MKNRSIILLTAISLLSGMTSCKTAADSTDQKTNESMTTAENMLIRISEIEVYPEYIDQYMKYAETVGATSVREESGVIAIYPMVQKRDSCQIRILEIYASMKDYERHIGTEHFQIYKQGTLHMVKSLDLVDMHPMNADAMPEIFRKMKPSSNL